MLVLSDAWDGAWVQVDGTAEVLDSPEALDPLVDYFRSMSGEHPDWDECRGAMARQDKSDVVSDHHCGCGQEPLRGGSSSMP